MDLGKVLTQLRLELDHLNGAIKSLEELRQRVANRPDLDPEKLQVRRRGTAGRPKRAAPVARRLRTGNRR